MEAQPAVAAGGYRRILWAVLAINAAMFVIEGSAGLGAGSVSLQADSLDFMGDAVNYALALFVLGRTIRWRAGAALAKAAAMVVFGLWVLGSALYHALAGGVPSALVMGGVGTLALVANVTCALLLFRYRQGDANMRSVWLCTRNDAFGNIAVVVAASGVLASGTLWPDVAVGLLLAGLALFSALEIARQALGEIRSAPRAAA